MLEKVLAIDLGGTKLAWALVDRRGRLTGQGKEATRQPDTLLQIQTVVRRHAGKARAVGVTVPGLARPDGTVWAPNLRGWDRMPLRRELERVSRLTVVVESDRNCAVLGETWLGAARGHSDAVCLIVGTGIGAGILSGGSLVRGVGELSGCAGWLAVTHHPRPEHRACGILETMAAGPAIAREAGTSSVQEAVRAAARGNRRAADALREAGRLLGLGTANIISLFNPRVVVLGGGVAAAGNILLQPLRRAARAWSQPLAARQVRIVTTQLGPRALLLGAARAAWETQTA